MTQNHDKGLAELARLALAQTHVAVKDPTSSARRLLLALEPLYAVNWTGKVLAIVGAGKNTQTTLPPAEHKLGEGKLH